MSVAGLHQKETKDSDVNDFTDFLAYQNKHRFFFLKVALLIIESYRNNKGSMKLRNAEHIRVFFSTILTQQVTRIDRKILATSFTLEN